MFYLPESTAKPTVNPVKIGGPMSLGEVQGLKCDFREQRSACLFEERECFSHRSRTVRGPSSNELQRLYTAIFDVGLEDGKNVAGCTGQSDSSKVSI